MKDVFICSRERETMAAGGQRGGRRGTGPASGEPAERGAGRHPGPRGLTSAREPPAPQGGSLFHTKPSPQGARSVELAGWCSPARTAAWSVSRGTRTHMTVLHCSLRVGGEVVRPEGQKAPWPPWCGLPGHVGAASKAEAPASLPGQEAAEPSQSAPTSLPRQPRQGQAWAKQQLRALPRW